MTKTRILQRAITRWSKAEILNWKSKYYDYYQQILNSKNYVNVEKKRDEILWDTTLELPAFSDMVGLNIIPYNSLDLEECYKSVNNLSNKDSISFW